MSVDLLISKIRKTKNPTVAGLDPRLEYLPEGMLQRHIAKNGETLFAAAEAFKEFNFGLIDALSDVVPAVKLQAACYEMLGVEGMRVMKETIDYAHKKELYVIADCKRNDIGSSAEGYAIGWLGNVKVGDTEIKPFDADALTVNGYLGSDGIKPFLEECKKGKMIFILVRTSNPSALELQDLVSGDRLVYQSVADLVYRWGKGLAGEYGYSQAGAVVGATYPTQLKELRASLPQTFFLVPGYGAQGGQAKDVAYGFDKYGRGAIVNASRSIMCAWMGKSNRAKDETGKNYAEAARNEALKMKSELSEYITVL